MLTHLPHLSPASSSSQFSYVLDWENNRSAEIAKLTSQGILPHEHNVAAMEKSGKEVTPQMMIDFQPMLMGQVAGNIEDVKTSQEIVNDMIAGAQKTMLGIAGLVNTKAKL